MKFSMVPTTASSLESRPTWAQARIPAASATNAPRDGEETQRFCEEALELLASPNALIEDVGILVAQDKRILSRLAAVVNSAHYGIPRRITDPTEIVAMLGFNTVKSILLDFWGLEQMDELAPATAPASGGFYPTVAAPAVAAQNFMAPAQAA